MSTGLHRLVVIACALSWFLVGMHIPIVHEIVGHGASPRWTVLVLLTLFVVMAFASVWVLLRLRDPSTAQATPGPRAT